MNTSLHGDKDADYKKACELSEKAFSHNELISLLESGNAIEKQYAALQLDFVNNQKEGKILVNSLTGCDGKIREAVALKINSILKAKPECREYFIYPEIFADATIDINGNICRLISEVAVILKSNKEFSEKYLQKIISYIKEAFAGLDKIIYKDKKYTVNKQLFKLYWCLDVLKYFTDDIESELLYNILDRTSKEKEYTIREKTAQIVILISDNKFDTIRKNLYNDDNYYVRNVFRKDIVVKNDIQ